MRVIRDKWTMAGAAQVALNLNTAMGPAPGGYLRLNDIEVIIDPMEMRALWDAWTEFYLPTIPQ